MIPGESEELPREELEPKDLGEASESQLSEGQSNGASQPTPQEAAGGATAGQPQAEKNTQPQEITDEDRRSILIDQLLSDKKESGLEETSEEFKRFKAEIENPEMTLRQLKNRIYKGNEALMQIMQEQDDNKRTQNYNEDYDESLRVEYVKKDGVSPEAAQRESVENMNELKLDLPPAEQRFLGRDGMVERPIRSRISQEISEDVKRKYIEALRVSIPEFDTLKPEEQQKFIVIHREHADQIKALIKEEESKTLESRVKNEKDKLLKSKTIEDSLKLILGEDDKGVKKESLLTSIRKAGMAWMIDEANHGIKANNFEEFLNFLFHPTAYGSSGGMEFKENRESGEKLITLSDFKQKVERPADFGASLKVAIETNRIGNVPGLRENRFKLIGNEHLKSEDEILQGLAKGNREAIHLTMKSLFTFMFEDESKRAERWEIVRAAIGRGLFGVGSGGDRVLAAEIGNFFKMLKENPDEFKRYFPIPGEGRTTEAPKESDPETVPAVEVQPASP